MRIYHVGGKIVRVLANEREAVLYGEPSAFDGVLDIDNTTNVQLVRDVSANTGRYGVQGGDLLKDGRVVAVAGDSTMMVAVRKVKAGQTLSPEENTALLHYLLSVVERLS